VVVLVSMRSLQEFESEGTKAQSSYYEGVPPSKFRIVDELNTRWKKDLRRQKIESFGK